MPFVSEVGVRGALLRISLPAICATVKVRAGVAADSPRAGGKANTGAAEGPLQLMGTSTLMYSKIKGH
eukprot:6305073-Heterocapsa_arctica.AAC.1